MADKSKKQLGQYAQHETRILRIAEVEFKVGLSRSQVYSLIHQGEFPSPIKLGARASGWLSTDIESWIQYRINLPHAN